MEIVGWITVITLCVIALIFIVIEFGPMLYIELMSWSDRKKKAIQAREDRETYRKQLKEFKRNIKLGKINEPPQLIEKVSDNNVEPDSNQNLCEQDSDTCSIEGKNEAIYSEISLSDLDDDEFIISDEAETSKIESEILSTAMETSSYVKENEYSTEAVSDINTAQAADDSTDNVESTNLLLENNQQPQTLFDEEALNIDINKEDITTPKQKVSKRYKVKGRKF